jgi:hypothetical protein
MPAGCLPMPRLTKFLFSKTAMPDHGSIPLYTKIGSRITTILLLLLSFMILKNCIGSVRYGITTSQEEINRYYDQGYMHGSRQHAEGDPDDAVNDNPLLKKAYRRGFRAGWDTKQGKATVNNIETPDR